MKTSLILLLALSSLAGLAADLPACPVIPPARPLSAEVTLTGVLQRRVSIGGETTGWVLRYDKGRTVELSFTIDTLSRLREGAWVTCTGTFETRKYPERGDVLILLVHTINDVQV